MVFNRKSNDDYDFKLDISKNEIYAITFSTVIIKIDDGRINFKYKDKDYSMPNKYFTMIRYLHRYFPFSNTTEVINALLTEREETYDLVLQNIRGNWYFKELVLKQEMPDILIESNSFIYNGSIFLVCQVEDCNYDKYLNVSKFEI